MAIGLFRLLLEEYVCDMMHEIIAVDIQPGLLIIRDADFDSSESLLVIICKIHQIRKIVADAGKDLKLCAEFVDVLQIFFR